MKAATVSEIKKELSNRPPKELLELCLHLSKFKKENKELLTYLLYEVSNEKAFIENVKSDVEDLFEEMNTDSYYYIKKSVRKILRVIKKYIRFSKKKQTEVELLIHFCCQLKELEPPISKNVTLQNLFDRQFQMIKKAISGLHEDLQYDYEMELERLE